MKHFLVLLVPLLLFSGCTSDSAPLQLRSLPSEQLFQIDPTRDTILYGDDGLRLFIPANSFRFPKGDLVQDEVEINLIEALHPADQILLDANGKFPLGAARIEAWQKNEQLQMVKGAKVLIQFPNPTNTGGLSLRSGTLKRKGDIKWSKGGNAKNFLVPVDFRTLPFHPPAFSKELGNCLPFGKFERHSLALADSLYFSFAGGRIPDLTNGLLQTQMNEALYQPHQEFFNWKYTAQSYLNEPEVEDKAYTHGADTWPNMDNSCGIDPGKVQAAKSDDFSQTFLATPAFAERLAVLLEIGEESLLDLYLDNLEKDLWEIDEQVKTRLQNAQHPKAETFAAFAVQGLTNTKEGEHYAELFRTTLSNRMAVYGEELNRQHAAIAAALKTENEQVASLTAAYQDLLWQREQHRMQALTFELTSTGWIWPHPEPEIAKDTVARVQLFVEVEERHKFDECYVYAVFLKQGSIYRLNEKRPGLFVVGSQPEPWMWMKLHQSAKVVAVAYRGERVYAAELPYRTGSDEALELELKRTSRKDLRATLRFRGAAGRANRIAADLSYLRQFKVERERQSALWSQHYALGLLAAKAYPACNDEPSIAEGRQLFQKHCITCHAADLKTPLTGPALHGITNEVTKMWFIRFTQNSQRMIAEGVDPRALQQWHDWGPTVMNSFDNLTVPEISAIYNYVQSQE
ncbi:MAG: cytochrome c [Bacteroidota bacterium]